MKNYYATPLKTIALLSLTLTVAAPAQGFGNKWNRNQARKAQAAIAGLGDLQDLGVLSDKFREHQRLTSGGGSYYDKSEFTLRAKHFGIYKAVQHAVLEDRISEEQARDAIQQLFTIGKVHKASPDSTKTTAQLSKLHASLRQDMSKEAPAGIITPKLNRQQFTLEEVIHFGTASGELTNGEINSLRRKLDSLESKEDKAKTGDSISDRNREKLIDEVQKIWTAALKDFK